MTLVPDVTTLGDNFWKLSLIHSGLDNEMPCLPFEATADEVDAQLGSLAVVNGGVGVTRRGSGTHGDPYVHTIYFEGANMAGDVNEVSARTKRRVCRGLLTFLWFSYHFSVLTGAASHVQQGCRWLSMILYTCTNSGRTH